jgi:hypothetical protein
MEVYLKIMDSLEDLMDSDKLLIDVRKVHLGSWVHTVELAMSWVRAVLCLARDEALLGLLKNLLSFPRESASSRSCLIDSSSLPKKISYVTQS